MNEMKDMNELTWVEISEKALSANVSQFRKLIGNDKLLCPCVKANAYGHGLAETSKILLESGADWLSVNAIYEARILRESGITAPILVLGYVPIESLKEALELDVRLTVYNPETIDRLSEEAKKLGKTAKVHIKAETGNNRQGVLADDLLAFAKHISEVGNIEIEGLSTHFANIEDTTDHSYARTQIERFLLASQILKENGINVAIKHCANSAATILFPETHFELVRVGIASYGMWTSKETYVAYLQERNNGFDLIPALAWKAKIAQVKNIPAGEFIGYGCTFRTTHETKLAIIPVGYYDGYDRGISNSYVLIHGKRAFLRGRVCMNMIMVDVTDIPEACLEDTVTLMGNDGDETITAEQFGAWAGSINYEVTTRVNDRILRVVV